MSAGINGKKDGNSIALQNINIAGNVGSVSIGVEDGTPKIKITQSDDASGDTAGSNYVDSIKQATTGINLGNISVRAGNGSTAIGNITIGGQSVQTGALKETGVDVSANNGETAIGQITVGGKKLSGPIMVKPGDKPLNLDDLLSK
jgi:hypothetical protein